MQTNSRTINTHTTIEICNILILGQILLLGCKGGKKHGGPKLTHPEKLIVKRIPIVPF